MKNKNNKNQNQKNTPLITDDYFISRMRQRFAEVDLTKVDEIIASSKRYSVKNLDSCPFQVVKNKLRNADYSDSVYLVNYRLNLIMVVVGNVLKNALYLDGTDGYSFN